MLKRKWIALAMALTVSFTLSPVSLAVGWNSGATAVPTWQPEVVIPDETTIVTPSALYTYSDMVQDINMLKQTYPSYIKVKIIGQSEEGRDIPVLIVGNPNAKKKVLIQAAIHGREHMTACIAMAQIEYSLKYATTAFAKTTIAGAMKNVCFHIVPMVNPDGVTISQSGILNQEQYNMYLRDLALGNTTLSASEYARKWKANANGVDLNNNFDAKWDDCGVAGMPSYAGYPGESPEDQSESKALADYARKNKFSATLSYHSTGSIIYWQFGTNKTVNNKSKSLANAVKAVTGYSLVSATESAGGFKDWVQLKLKVPSVTIEIGTQSCPLPLSQYNGIWIRNKTMLAVVGNWVNGK